MHLASSELQRGSYTPAQVGIICGVKPSTVYAWLSRKELRGQKVGHRRYVTPQQLREFQEQRKNGDYIDYTYANGPLR